MSHRPPRTLGLITASASALLVLLSASPASAEPNQRVCDDACRIDAAASYVDALVSHDPTDVPFHPQATRVEAGLMTGFSGRQLAFDLRHGPQYRIIRSIDDRRFVVRDGVVVADFTLDVGVGPVRLATADVHETFVVTSSGQIRTIRADIALGSLL